jgi:bacterioferritin-associated ferredoxin
MFICVCKGVTDCQIREAVCEGACSMRELRARLGVASQCGRCACHAKRVLEETLGCEDFEENDKAA